MVTSISPQDFNEVKPSPKCDTWLFGLIRKRCLCALDKVMYLTVAAESSSMCVGRPLESAAERICAATG